MRRSSPASAGVSQTPVMISIVLWNSSCLAFGCSPPGWVDPNSASSSLAAETRSPVMRSTTWSSISMPTVGRSLWVNSIVMMPDDRSSRSAVAVEDFGHLLRCGCRSESSDDVAVLVDQELLEVPGDVVLAPSPGCSVLSHWYSSRRRRRSPRSCRTSGTSRRTSRSRTRGSRRRCPVPARRTGCTGSRGRPRRRCRRGAHADLRTEA